MMPYASENLQHGDYIRKKMQEDSCQWKKECMNGGRCVGDSNSACDCTGTYHHGTHCQYGNYVIKLLAF